MTVDYAKRPRPSRDTNRLSIVFWLVSLFVLAAGALLGLKMHEQRLHQKAVLAAIAKPVPVTKVATDAQKNQFDFYNILPKKS